MDGDDESFAEFVVREQAGLLRLATLLAGNAGNGEDLVQTALLEVYRRWSRVSRGRPLVRRTRTSVASSGPAARWRPDGRLHGPA